MKRLVYVGTAVLAVALFGCQRRTTEQPAQGGEEGTTQQGTGAYGGGSEAGQQDKGQTGTMGQEGKQGQPGAAQGEQTGAYGAGEGGSCARVSSCFSKISDQLCRGDSRCESTFSSRNVPQSESACQAELSRVSDLVKPFARQQANFQLPSECQAAGGQGSTGQEQGGSQGQDIQGGSSGGGMPQGGGAEDSGSK